MARVKSQRRQRRNRKQRQRQLLNELLDESRRVLGKAVREEIDAEWYIQANEVLRRINSILIGGNGQ